MRWNQHAFLPTCLAFFVMAMPSARAAGTIDVNATTWAAGNASVRVTGLAMGDVVVGCVVSPGPPVALKGSGRSGAAPANGVVVFNIPKFPAAANYAAGDIIVIARIGIGGCDDQVTLVAGGGVQAGGGGGGPCLVCNDPLTPLCLPGQNGALSCPCSNPPASSGVGCNNFGQHTGGAQLSGTGLASVSADSIVFTSQFENNTAFTIFMQGTATTNAVFGAGIRCVGGTLKRLYMGAASGGTIVKPTGADPSVSSRSAALGYVISPPITLYYMAYYRDPSASSPCGGATFNATQSGSLNWIP